MSKLSPKGDRNHESMPLGRWGDGGMSALRTLALTEKS